MSGAELSGVTKRFGSDVIALDDVSLAIEAGEFLSIVGPSGCGKTTLLRLLAGFEMPTAGTISIAGREVSTPARGLAPERRDIGMVFQTFALWPHLRVAEQVRFPLRHRRHLAADIAADPAGRVDAVLAMTGLTGYRDRFPAELSGGQQQRVGLARAIAARPSLLLMDEPLSALDAELAWELRREVQTLHQVTEAAIVYVTHNQSEALSMSDRVAVMRDGRIEQLGSPAEIFAAPATEFVARFVGRASLVPGRWDGDDFLPAAGDERVRWRFPDVRPELRASGHCPTRPDQLELVEPGGTDDSDETTAVTGIVRNTLFAGREQHYVVEVAGLQLEVYMPAEDRRGGRPIEVGDEVGVRPRG